MSQQTTETNHQPAVLLHFAEASDTSGYFPQLASWHDSARYKMIFATLKPMAPWLRAYMEERGIECFSCRCTKRSQYGLGILRLMKFLRRRRVQILHTHLFEPSIIGLIAGKLAHTPHLVMTRHYSDYHTRVGRTRAVRLDQLCTSLCQRVIAVSQHTADGMIEDEGAPSEKIAMIYNGVDFDRLKLPSPEELQALRRELAPNGEFLLLQVARLHPEKGHEFLLHALPAVREAVQSDGGPPVKLLLAGAGPYEAAYRAQVQELGIESMVEFLGFRRDAPSLMAVADVMVLPSVAEAFGLVITEALYLGTPVISTQVGGIPEIVGEGEGGILVPPASPEALATAIINMRRDAEARQRLAGAGRDKVLRQFSFERMVRDYEALYDRLLNLQR
jgi:glycosyltransferase involved in cell wall biosynthesis